MTKRKRVEAVLGLCFLWGAVALQVYSLFMFREEDQLLETFASMEAIPAESCIEMTAPLNKLYLNQDEKKQVLEEFAKDLGVTSGYTWESEESDQMESLTLKKTGTQGEIQISITSLTIEMENQNTKLNQYLFVSLQTKQSLEQLLAGKEKLEKTAKTWNLTASYNFNLKGERKGKLSEAEEDKLEESLFSYLKAKQVESTRKENEKTVYGHSELWKNTLSFAEREINVRLVFSYKEKEDSTEFFLVFPFFRQEENSARQDSPYSCV